MTRDDIIRMAGEAGAFIELSTTPEKDMYFLERFANLVANHVLVQPCCGNFEKCQRLCMPRAAAAEREACAKVCENYPDPIYVWTDVKAKFADAIRARREQ